MYAWWHANVAVSSSIISCAPKLNCPWHLGRDYSNPAQFASLPLWRLRVAVIISAVSLSIPLTSAMPALVYFSSCFNHAGSRQRLDISSVYHSPISYVTFLSYISVYSDLCLLFITTTKCYGAAHACLPILSTEYPTTRTNTYRAAPFHVIPYIGKRYVVT